MVNFHSQLVRIFSHKILSIMPTKDMYWLYHECSDCPYIKRKRWKNTWSCNPIDFETVIFNHKTSMHTKGPIKHASNESHYFFCVFWSIWQLICHCDNLKNVAQYAVNRLFHHSISKFYPAQNITTDREIEILNIQVAIYWTQFNIKKCRATSHAPWQLGWSCLSTIWKSGNSHEIFL